MQLFNIPEYSNSWDTTSNNLTINTAGSTINLITLVRAQQFLLMEVDILLIVTSLWPMLTILYLVAMTQSTLIIRVERVGLWYQI